MGTGRGQLDPFRAAIADLIEQDPPAPATIITQRLRTLGCDGGKTIVRDCLRPLDLQTKARRAYVHGEPGPGERFDIDWGHFGSLLYNGAPRKLYAFFLVEAHSRKLYLSRVPSQSFEAVQREPVVKNPASWLPGYDHATLDEAALAQAA